MRPLSDRKSCEQHLIAHFQWRFLRFQLLWTNDWNEGCILRRPMAKACQWVSLWGMEGDLWKNIDSNRVSMKNILAVNEVVGWAHIIKTALMVNGHLKSWSILPALVSKVQSCWDHVRGMFHHRNITQSNLILNLVSKPQTLSQNHRHLGTNCPNM